MRRDGSNARQLHYSGAFKVTMLQTLFPPDYPHLWVMKRSAASASHRLPQNSWSNIAPQWSEHAPLFMWAAAAAVPHLPAPCCLLRLWFGLVQECESRFGRRNELRHPARLFCLPCYLVASPSVCVYAFFPLCFSVVVGGVSESEQML